MHILRKVGPRSNLKQSTRFAFCSYQMATAATSSFRRGAMVEVASHQEGFWGSFWEASIVAKLDSGNRYAVKYKTLLEDDLTGPLKEAVSSCQVRPMPPKLKVERYQFGDRVDAFDNDGWWIGTINGVNIDDGVIKYYVYFDYFNVEVVYDATSLRMHQDWIHGKWH